MKIKRCVLRLIAMTAAPALVAAVIVAGAFVGLERDGAASALRQTARAMSGKVDQELLASMATLETLAATLGHGPVDSSRFARVGSALLVTKPRWREIILADASGHRLLDVLGGGAAVLPEVGDPPTYDEVLRTGQSRISRVLVMPPDRKQIVVLGVPVVVEGKPRYVLLGAVETSVFADGLQGRDLPSAWSAGLLDEAGGVVAGSGASSLPSIVDSLIRRAPHEPEGWLEGVGPDGAKSYAAYSRTNAAPWKIVLSVPARALGRSIASERWAGLGAGLVVALLGMLLALTYARRLVASVQSLAAYAEATGRGQTMGAPPAVAIEELDGMSRTLVVAGRRAQEHAEQRREAERARHESEAARGLAEERRIRLFEALPEAACLVDCDTLTITDANEAARRMYGYSREEVRGMSLRDLSALDEPLHGSRTTAILPMTATGERRRHRTKDGVDLDVDVRARHLDSEEGRTAILVAVDLTSSQRLERQRLQQIAAEQAARADAVAAAETAADCAARQQLLSELGVGFLHDTSLNVLLDEALARLAAVLRVDYAEFLELLPNRSAFRLRAGFGWKPETVGHASADIERFSPAGYAVLTGSPVVCDDLADETRFAAPAFHRSHGIVSGASVVIGQAQRPFGALGVHATRRHAFSAEDIRLLRTVADLLGRMIGRQRSEDERATLLRREQEARAAAESSAQHYRLLTETIPQMVWTSRVDGWVDYFNERFLDFTGLAFGESKGWRWQALLHPDDLRQCLQRWNNALTTGEQLEVECRVKDKDGAYRWHLLRALPVRNETGAVKSWLGTYTDIDDQKRAEKERQRLLDAEQAARAEAQLAGQCASFLSDASRVLTSSLDCETTLARLARLAVSQIGDWCAVDIVAEDGAIRRVALAHLDPAIEELGEELLRLYPNDPQAAHGVPRVLAAGRAEFYSASPERLWVHGSLDPEAEGLFRRLRSAMIVPLVAHERVLGTITFLAGESSRPYTPADLALAEELALRATLAFDNARLYTEAERRRREAHELARVAAGLTQSLDAEALAQRIVEALLPLFGVRRAALRLLQPDGSLLAIAVAGESPDHFEVGHVLPAGVGLEGKVAAEWKPLWTPDLLSERGLTFDADSHARLAIMGHHAGLAVPFRADTEIVGVLSISDDKLRDFAGADVALLQTFANQAAVALLNARLYAEAHRGRREAELAHTEAEAANRAKDAFLATLSHELRTPLTAMLGWAHLLGSGKLDPTETARAVQIIERNTRVQVQLIDDLLDISRIISGKLRLDLGPVELASVIEDAVDSMRQVAEAKGIDVTPLLDPTIVEGDRARLHQVVSNILSNALKFTPEGGQVQVRLERAGSHAQIVMTDTGPGIGPDLLPHIFDRFRQGDSSTTSPHEGLGLGLAIVRHVVELHGGTVAVANREERSGAMVTVALPLVARDRATVEPMPPQDEHQATRLGPTLAGTRILVVEDSRDTREFISASLSSLGAEVIAAASADDALARLETSGAQIIVSDIRMPGKDGYAFIREVRAYEARRGGRTPAVALTAFANADERAAAFAAGFDMHLAKPVDPRDLTTTVRQLLDAAYHDAVALGEHPKPASRGRGKTGQ